MGYLLGLEAATNQHMGAGRVEDLWDLQEMALAREGQDKLLEVFCCRAVDDNFTS